MASKSFGKFRPGNFAEGTVVHTLGFPSDTRTYGGGWIYGMKNNVVSIGYVTGLDYEDPMIDPHAEFQKFKTHPKVAAILAGGKMIKYGAKTINAGGYYTMPKLYADGVLLVGRLGVDAKRPADQGHSHRYEIGHAGGRNDRRSV